MTSHKFMSSSTMSTSQWSRSIMLQPSQQAAAIFLSHEIYGTPIVSQSLCSDGYPT
jgi:hypothetical protein